MLTFRRYNSFAGGSAGIGKATAIGFSNNGAIVTITGRRQERLDAVTKQLKEVHHFPPSILSVLPANAHVHVHADHYLTAHDALLVGASFLDVIDISSEFS